ncbi:MAG: RagB/SusD family nutrient uptake outer membrane protein [Bacteroidales bacterium]|nr:RagB/SusD family nutrient uptake outer membrane protein [Bacteroidales bacterium]
MKKNIINMFLCAGFAVCAAVSCKDVVDIPASDRLTQDVIWSGDEAILDQYVIGLYGAVREKSTLYMLTNQYTDCMTDVLKDGDYMQERRYNRLNIGTQVFTDNDASILGNWADSYTRIRRFNEFFRDVETYGGMYDEAFIKKRKAEIRFLRAMQYFYIMRVYGYENDTEDRPGGMILRDKLEGPAGNNKQRMRYAESWQWIIDEIKSAATDLPQSWEESNFTRMTSVAAYGFLSRVALYAKQWDEVISAADECAKLGAALDPSYANVFADQKSVENIMTISFLADGLSHNADAVFRPSGDTPHHNNRASAYVICPTAELADSYEMADGTAFSWADYNANPAAWGGDPFSGREPRFYATIIYNNEDWEGRKIESFVGGVDGIQEFEETAGRNSTCTGYYYRKFITENDHSWDEKGSNHFDILLRYGEVLLNKAEALAQKDWSANSVDALKALNDIRGRVGLPAKPAASLEEFMLLLEQERKVELAGENFRYWDLRRWRLAVERLNDKSFHGVKITKNPDDTFKYEECDIDAGSKRLFMDRFYCFALPLSELNNNTALNHVNNPGW